MLALSDELSDDQTDFWWTTVPALPDRFLAWKDWYRIQLPLDCILPQYTINAHRIVRFVGLLIRFSLWRIGLAVHKAGHHLVFDFFYDR